MTEDAQLYDDVGRRLYLTTEERRAFLAAAKQLPRIERTFCTVLHDTGCRISEALELSGRRVDLAAGTVIVRTLKKRNRTLYRPIPLPPGTLDLLDMVHGLSEARNAGRSEVLDVPLWPFSRTTGWRIVKRAMDAAGIADGPHRSPKGLRHAYGINAILSSVPITSLRKWMGHAKLETTAIYLEAVGAENREIAARMWS